MKITIVTDKEKLRKPVRSIDGVDKKHILEIMKNLAEAYDERPGCQLICAKQIDEPYDLVLMKKSKTDREFVVDLSIIKEGITKVSSEGSYSIRGRYHVKRYKNITASYGVVIPNEDFTDFSILRMKDKYIENMNVARVMQHAYDLNRGKLLCDTGRLFSLVDKAKVGGYKEW